MTYSVPVIGSGARRAKERGRQCVRCDCIANARARCCAKLLILQSVTIINKRSKWFHGWLLRHSMFPVRARLRLYNKRRLVSLRTEP